MFHFHVKRSESCYPADAVHDVGAPAELADGLDSASDEENGAFVVYFGPVYGFMLCRVVAVEKVIVVDKIYLQACGLQCGHFNDERVVGVVNDNVHARETNHFVQLVASLVDGSVFRHECAHFGALFLKALR